MKTQTIQERLKQVADSVDALGAELTTDDIVCISVFSDFVALQVTETGVTKLQAKIGQPVEEQGRLTWVNPAIVRDPWMSDDTFRWASRRWPGKIELVATKAPAVAEPVETPAVIEDGFVVVDSKDIPVLCEGCYEDPCTCLPNDANCDPDGGPF